MPDWLKTLFGITPEEIKLPPRIPTKERSCEGKVNLGRNYKRQADRLSRKHGKAYGVYSCGYCCGTHLTTRLKNRNGYKPLLYITKQMNNMTTDQLFEAVREWGRARGITGPTGRGTLPAQLGKTQEELTETRDAMIELAVIEGLKPELPADYYEELVTTARAKLADGIGDVLVTVILAAQLAELDPIRCLSDALAVISRRAGRMENGVFIKDAP